MTLENGLSEKQRKIINILVGVSMASGLDREEKQECIAFLRDLEVFFHEY